MIIGQARNKRFNVYVLGLLPNSKCILSYTSANGNKSYDGVFRNDVKWYDNQNLLHISNNVCVFEALEGISKETVIATLKYQKTAKYEATETFEIKTF